MFQIVSGLFHFVSCGSGCSCCFELFPIVLVLVLLVADCFYSFQVVFQMFCVVLTSFEFSDVQFGCSALFYFVFDGLKMLNVLCCFRLFLDCFWIVFEFRIFFQCSFGFKCDSNCSKLVLLCVKLLYWLFQLVYVVQKNEVVFGLLTRFLKICFRLINLVHARSFDFVIGLF